MLRLNHLSGFGGRRASAPALFSDDFNDNSLDGALWTRITNTAGFTVTETSQQLQVAVTSGTNGADGIVTVSSYDVTSQNASVEAIQPVGSPPVANINVKMLFVLIDASNRFFGFSMAWGGADYFLGFEHSVGSTTSTAYNATNHRWVRMRPDTGANSMIWETSPDNSAWTTQRTITSWSSTAYTKTAMKLRLQFNFNASPGSTTTQIWDNARIG